MSSGVWDHLKRVMDPPADDAGMIVSLDEAKLHCRVSRASMINEDDWFRDAIYTAQGWIDGPHGAGISLLTQQWRLSLDRWPQDYMILPIGPIQSVDEITWLDLAYVEHTLDPAMYVYDLDADPVHVRRAFGVVWPILGITPGAVKVKFTTGFGDTAAKVPRDLKQAVKFLVSHFYNHRDAVVGVDNRDSSAPLPLGVDAILDRYRVGRIA